MNGKKTLVLAAVLGLAIVYLTKVMMPKHEQQASGNVAFAKLQASDIGSVEVMQSSPDAGGEQRYTVARQPAPEKASPTKKKAEGDSAVQDDGIWSLSAVRGALMDSAAMSRFVQGLRELTVEGPLNEKDRYSDLSLYGLAKPELITIVHERSGRATEVAFGKKSQYLSKRYVKISGRSGIFMADDLAFENLNKSSSDLRSKTPFRFNSSDVRTMLLTSAQGRIELQQPSVGEWKITKPAEYRASNEDVEAFLRALQNVTVSEFIDGQYEKRDSFGFSYPRLSVVIQFREGIAPEQAAFSLANANARSSTEQAMYALTSNSETIFKLASDPSPALVKKVDDLRYKQIVEVPFASLDKVVGTTADSQPVTVAASGKTWTVNGKESDPMFVEQLLRDITSLGAVRFPETVPADAFEKPFLILAITGKDADKQSVTVTIGKEFAADTGDTLRYVRSSASDLVFGVRDVEAKRVVPHEEALVAAKTETPAAAPGK
jgi:hypothetical protein